jgi:Holliday junction resolvasome RuvABC ATP-dependent DNA helicase subunit
MKNLSRKFNPELNQDDRLLIQQYVVRLPLLKILLETIQTNTNREACQHHLYFGPRGRGKTMLMARVAVELRSNP